MRALDELAAAFSLFRDSPRGGKTSRLYYSPLKKGLIFHFASMR